MPAFINKIARKEKKGNYGAETVLQQIKNAESSSDKKENYLHYGLYVSKRLYFDEYLCRSTYQELRTLLK